MSVDAFLDELSEEARAEMRVLLRKAYETGFREALAGTGQAAVAPTEAEPAAAHASAAAPSAVPVAWERKVEDSPAVALGDDVDDGEDDDDDAEEASAPRPILANAKVGTLRRRIIRTFDLERFEIDVVICRSGDPDRRQLKSSARLGLYRRGDV